MSGEIKSTPPRRRKSAMLTSPGLNSTSDIMLLDVNDDAKEKRARRRSQLLTNNISSPGGVPASPGRVNVAADREKRKSVNQAGAMSNDQVKAHYASCIKLSSENKINIKNAFALHLIDYMKELLKESQSVDSGTNFQVASCTLDAGVKIYSYRVDSVHKDTFKVLGSLGGAVDNKDDEDGGEGDEAEGAEGSQKTKTVKKRKNVTIEKNLNKITSEQFDLDFEVDPYFHKTSAAFDEGGVKGLLLLQVRTDTDSNHLRLDSDTSIKDEEVRVPIEGIHEDMDFFKASCSKCDAELQDICPPLKSFHLCGWDKDSEGTSGLLDDSFDDNVHRFDVNAPVIPPESNDMDFDTDYGGGAEDFSDNENQNDEGIGPVEFDTREAHFSNAANASLMNLTGASTMPLELFPLQRSEYSFFRTDILSMWRGPLHWKYNPAVVPKEKSDVKRGRVKKDPFRIDFDDDTIDVKKMISSGRAQTYLKEKTLIRHTSQMTTLPPKVIYEAKTLFNMFLQDKFVMKSMAEIPTSKLENEDDVAYNYDNKNDREGFCPAVMDEDRNNYDDYDDDVGGGADASFDETSHPMGLIADSESLIAPPAKVRMLDINYAKSAKRIDIKKLKRAMWNMLTITDKDKENIDTNNLPRPDIAAEEEEDKDKSVVSGNYTFKSMYSELPSKITTNMAKNLSGPISFVCLLYLANEKNLALTSTENMDDILIVSDKTRVAC